MWTAVQTKTGFDFFFTPTHRCAAASIIPSICAYITYVLMCFLARRHFFNVPSAGRFSFSRIRGTQGARPDPARKFRPRPRSMAHALGVQSGKSPRGGTPSTYSHPGPCKPTCIIPGPVVYFNLWVKKCPTAHAASMILNVVNIARRYLMMERYFLDT